MKKYKSFIYLLVIIVFSNLPPFQVFFELFSGDSIVPGIVDDLYVTKDLKYIYGGRIKDTLTNDCYRQYRALYPMSNPKLHRTQPIQPWKFWHWGEYLIKEKWRQPYRHVTYKEMDKAFAFFYKAYDSPNGTLDCVTYYPPR